MARRQRTGRNRHPGSGVVGPGSSRRGRSGMGRVRSSREGCTIAEVCAAFKFVFKLFRALLNNMKEAHGGQELVGVVDSGVVEPNEEREGVCCPNLQGELEVVGV